MARETLRYLLVDVFARRPFTGNQLAVVLDADGLATEQMQVVAREFNLAETTFPVRRTPEDERLGAEYRVRIFTASREIPFAGHPTLGTAWVLAREGRLAPGERRQACGAGLVGVSIPADPTAPVELSAQPRDLSSALSTSVAHALLGSVGLALDDVAGPVFAAGCGLTWIHIPVRPAAIGRAHPRLAPMGEVDLDGSALGDPLIGINLYAADGAAVRSRVFVPGPAVPEDPATGSAAVGLGVALVAAGSAAADGETSYEIEQGVELGRPSYLSGRVSATAGKATRCWVAGLIQPVGSGTIAVPPG